VTPYRFSSKDAQRRRPIGAQTDRVLYVWGLFAPPKPQATVAPKNGETPTRSLPTIGILAAFALIMGLVALVGDYGVLETAKLRGREQQLQQELQRMQRQEKMMLAEVDALRHSPEYINFIARRDLSLATASEVIIYLPPELQLPEESAYSPFSSLGAPAPHPPRRRLELPPRLSTSSTNSDLNGEFSQLR
jgi:cell division protein FtsB